MNSFIGPILSYILLYKYPVLFIVQFLSALIVPFPANTTVVAVGAFASIGYVSPTISLIIAVAGNIAGDLAGYWIARSLLRYKTIVAFIRGQSRGKVSGKISFYANRLEGGVRSYAGRMIFVTRFTPALQSIINFLAGLAEVSFWIFVLWDFLGNVINVSIYFVIGWIIGLNWEEIAGIFGIAGGILLVIVLIVVVGWIYKNVVKRQI